MVVIVLSYMYCLKKISGVLVKETVEVLCTSKKKKKKINK